MNRPHSGNTARFTCPGLLVAPDPLDLNLPPIIIRPSCELGVVGRTRARFAGWPSSFIVTLASKRIDCSPLGLGRHRQVLHERLFADLTSEAVGMGVVRSSRVHGRPSFYPRLIPLALPATARFKEQSILSYLLVAQNRTPLNCEARHRPRP